MSTREPLLDGPELYEAACEGNPEAIVEYLKNADPEAVNHAILSYIEDIEGDRNFYLTERDRLQVEVKRLAGELFDLSGRLMDEARKAGYVAAEAVRE